MYGVEPFGSVPYGYVKDAGIASKLSIAADSRTGHVYIVEFSAKRIGGDEVTLRYATNAYVSPNTTGGENDNIYFGGRVEVALQLTRMLPVVPESQARAALNLGTIDLINTDGNFDDVIRNYALDGRDIRVLLGLQSYAYRDFTPIFTGSIVEPANDLQKLSLTVRDKGYKLDRPLQTNFYAGTGGAEGGIEIKNTPKPICLGYVFNITPVFIDPANLVYQIHDGALDHINNVKDSGAFLTLSGDYATYAALIAATLTTGHYATAIAVGMIRLGGTPAGGVTVDILNPTLDGELPNCSEIALGIRSIGQVPDSDIDLGRFQALDDRLAVDIGSRDDPSYPETQAGFYQSNTAISVADSFDKFFGGIAGWWGCDTADGTISCGIIWPANEDYAVLDLQEADIEDIEVLPPIDGTYPPRWKQNAGYYNNYTIQGPSELAGSVSQSNVQLFGLPYQVIVASDPDVLDDFQFSSESEVLLTPFTGQVFNEPFRTASRIIDLLGVQNLFVRAGILESAFKVTIGGTVTLTHPRVNGGNLWAARVVGMNIDTSSRTFDIELFGASTADAPDGGGGPSP